MLNNNIIIININLNYNNNNLKIILINTNNKLMIYLLYYKTVKVLFIKL